MMTKSATEDKARRSIGSVIPNGVKHCIALAALMLLSLPVGASLVEASLETSAQQQQQQQQQREMTASPDKAGTTTPSKSNNTKNSDVGSKTEANADTKANTPSFVEDASDLLTMNMVNWVLQHEDAFISPKIQIRRLPDQPIRGVYALEDIEEDETLVKIPWDLMITPPETLREEVEEIYLESIQEEEHEWYIRACLPVLKVYHAMQEETPYGAYLKAQPRGYLPNMWTEQGKTFLRSILPEWLPPTEGDLNYYLYDDYWKDCKDLLGLPDLDDLEMTHTKADKSRARGDQSDSDGEEYEYEYEYEGEDEASDGDIDGDDEGDAEAAKAKKKLPVKDYDMDLFLHAWMMVVARAEDDWMIPVYCNFNHANGDALNTAHVIEREEYFSLVAAKTILAGSQVFNSYNQCNFCGERHHHFGTPQMFMDYGFIEQYPQRYMINWEDVRFKFDIHQVDDDEVEDDEPVVTPKGIEAAKDGDSEEPLWQADFLSPLSPDAVTYMKDSVEGLRRSLSQNKERACPDNVPSRECDVSWQMHEAYLTAFSVALLSSEHMEVTDEVWEMGKYWYSPGLEYYDDEEDEKEEHEVGGGEEEDDDDDDDEDDDDEDDDDDDDDEDDDEEDDDDDGDGDEKEVKQQQESHDEL